MGHWSVNSKKYKIDPWLITLNITKLKYLNFWRPCVLSKATEGIRLDRRWTEVGQTLHTHTNNINSPLLH